MRIITVSGAHSNVGKTRVAEMLLKELKGWSGLKVTVLHNGPCPTSRDCGACNEIGSEFSIVSDKNIIEEKGKDTQRLKAQGAKEVLWLKAKPEGLREGLKKAIAKFSAKGGSSYGGKGPRGIIIESNSALKYLKPDLAIFVKGHRREKNSAQLAFKKADLVITL